LIGSAGEKKRGILRRAAAKVGDKIAGDEFLGSSAAGLEMLEKA